MANCFVIMPFRPELGYLYRQLKQYLEQAFPGISVVRGDDQLLTVPLLQKIADYIRQADVVLADCGADATVVERRCNAEPHATMAP